MTARLRLMYKESTLKLGKKRFAGRLSGAEVPVPDRLRASGAVRFSISSSEREVYSR